MIAVFYISCDDNLTPEITVLNGRTIGNYETLAGKYTSVQNSYSEN